MTQGCKDVKRCKAKLRKPYEKTVTECGAPAVRGGLCAEHASPREADIQQDIRLGLGLEPGLILFRNNIGAAVHHDSGRPVQYGVGGKGGSDLIGLLTVSVSTICDNPNDCDGSHVACVGHQRKIARFIALEIKRPGGRVSAEQWGFIELVRNAGGFAAIVHDVEEAKSAIQRARMGERG